MVIGIPILGSNCISPQGNYPLKLIEKISNSYNQLRDEGDDYYNVIQEMANVLNDIKIKFTLSLDVFSKS